MSDYYKLYYEIHKEKYHERYMRDREKIKERNEGRKEEKAMYDHLRNIEKWEQKAAYNREYYRRKKHDGIKRNDSKAV